MDLLVYFMNTDVIFARRIVGIIDFCSLMIDFNVASVVDRQPVILHMVLVTFIVQAVFLTGSDDKTVWYCRLIEFNESFLY